MGKQLNDLLIILKSVPKKSDVCRTVGTLKPRKGVLNEILYFIDQQMEKDDKQKVCRERSLSVR